MSPKGSLVLLGLGLWLLCFAPAYAQEKPTGKPWTGKWAYGRVITEADLRQILQDHELWLRSDKKQGERANLEGANLSGAKLWNANLSGAKLLNTRLSGADLWCPNLSGADLRKAKLSLAKLSGADMSRADLSLANLSRSDLSDANLSGAFLLKANLSGANLYRANLSRAVILDANLSGAELWGADLSGAKLREANLSGAFLLEANLSGADLWSANLNGASLVEANLSRSYLQDANLSESNLRSANLSGAFFQPKPGSLPGFSLLGIKGLDSLTFDGTSSYALVELREIYKKGGMREEERQVNFSLQHTRRVNTWKALQEKYEGYKQKKKEENQENNEKKEEVDLLAREWGRLENIFQLVMFEWTCKYGMTPGRPLRIMGMGVILFTFPYFLSLFSRNPKTGIWRLLPTDRVLDKKMKDAPEKLRAKIWEGDVRAWGIAFYFSLLSAFHIGWRDLNVGSWIARLQRKEYNLRATGWVRTVSGLQSLLSVYMLALWALSYFGRPFE